jgi:hypothetical protein
MIGPDVEHRPLEHWKRFHWKRFRTTNMMGRVNKEVKRRTKVAGVFPNEESLIRLVRSILMDVNEEWVTGRKYFDDGEGMIRQGDRTQTNYRISETLPHPASDYRYTFTTPGGEKQRIFWLEGIAAARTNCWFTQKLCSGSRGTCLVLVGPPAVREVLERGQGNQSLTLQIEENSNDWRYCIALQ